MDCLDLLNSTGRQKKGIDMISHSAIVANR